MSFNKVGINQIFLCDKGTLLTSPTSKIILGLRPAATLNITPFNPIKDYRERSLRNRLNFKVSAKTFQPNLLMLSNILTAFVPDGGCDAELLAVPQSTGADGGCFQFNGNDNFIGIDFDYIFSNTERALGIDLELSKEYLSAKAIIDASDANTPATTGSSSYGIDFAVQRHPWVVLSDATFSKDELLNYSFSMKSQGEKSYDNRTIIDYIMFRVELTFKAATIPNIVTVLARDQSPALVFQEDTSLASATYEKFSFAAGALSLVNEVEIGDNNRFIKLIYEGKVPVGNISFEFTTAKGGGTSQTGTEGGTVTVAV